MNHKIILGSVLWVMPLLLTSVDLAVPDGQVYAAQTRAAKADKQKTRKVPAMREKTYKTIAEAQLLIENEQPRESVPVLRKLLERKGLNNYEMAQVWNMLAFAYYSLDDMDNTIKAYRKVLDQGEITLALELGTLRSLFQLYYQKEEYRTAISYIDKWILLNETPDPGVLYLKATGYYQLDEFREGLKYALQVISVAESQQKTVKENWLYMLVVLYNELKDFDNVIKVLERLIVEYPKKQYWMHLAGLYSEKDMDDEALSAYYSAYVQNMLTRETELVMLSQRLLNAEIPHEAALIVSEGMKKGIIKEDERNSRLLAQSWTMAQNTQEAIDAWGTASKYAEDGEAYYRLAQALANDDQHKKAVKAYQDALDKGELDKPHDVEFWMGISLMQLERWNNAIKAFRSASKDKRKAKQCRQYIKYINGEKRRQEELRKMLAM